LTSIFRQREKGIFRSLLSRGKGGGGGAGCVFGIIGGSRYITKRGDHRERKGVGSLLF